MVVRRVGKKPPKTARRYVVNPKSGRRILVGGVTYKALKKKGVRLRSMTSMRKLGKRYRPRRYVRKPRRTKGKGCSNVFKYSPQHGPFCGPAGGSCSNTFPVGTRDLYRGALAHAWAAPDPIGIRLCATYHANRMGW